MIREKGTVTETGSERSLMLAFQVGRGHNPRNTGSFWKLEKTRNQIHSWRLQKGMQPCRGVDFNPKSLVSDGLRDSRIIHFCCLKSPSLCTLLLFIIINIGSFCVVAFISNFFFFRTLKHCWEFLRGVCTAFFRLLRAFMIGKRKKKIRKRRGKDEKKEIEDSGTHFHSDFFF